MDFLDAYQEIRNLTMKKKTILYAWEKAGLWPFAPRVVIQKLNQFEPP